LAYQSRAASPRSEIRFIAARSLLTHIGVPLAAAWQVVREWRRRWRSRRQLRSLTAREIRDFCPDLTVAEREAGKPFWRA
jgi:uncharacterized protein YjiS (DUF1127 family)